ncbi:MAG: hypothetical protein AB7S26_24105 [Sandaracinaceae bacterium]
MHVRHILIGAALSLTVLAVGCEGFVLTPGGTPDPDPGGPGPGGSCDMQAILSSAQNRCVTCHDATPGVEGGNLDLVSPDVSARLLNQPSGNSRCGGALLVDGEHPQDSLVLRLVDPARHDAWGADACVSMMPFDSDGVSAHDVACFERWVDDIAAGRDPGDPGGPPPIPFEPMPPSAALSRVKLLLHGGAMTDEELARVTAPDGSLDREGLRGVIESWRGTPELQRKLQSFLQLSLQQYEVNTGRPYTSQLDMAAMFQTSGIDANALFANLEQSFVRTSWEIVDTDQDFRNVVTTRTWRVTTAMLAALVYMESDRARRGEDRFQYMAHLTPGDYEDWRSVTFSQARSAGEVMSYENTAGFVSSLRRIPDGGTLPLRAPRVGFFNTPVFFESWETNPDNQFRVTTSQTLITALDLIFEAGDTTEVTSLNGLAEEHAMPDTACYQCHRELDPMRLQFMNVYSFENRSLTDRSDALPPTFAFQGVNAEPQTMDELASVIANHPRFATAWTQKLCMWANSARCDESDPELQRIADGFARDFDLWQLVLEVFTSPLVTASQSTLTHERSEYFISVARANHVCEAFETRLDQARAERCEEERAADPGGLEPATCLPRTRGAVCSFSRTARDMAEVLSRDAYSRGARDLVQDSLTGPFNSRALNELCTAYSPREIGTQTDRTFDPNDPEDSLDRMVRYVMGLPVSHPRYEAARAALDRSFDIARATPLCADTGQDLVADNADNVVCGLGLTATRAMYVSWIVACSSPELAGVGL